MRSESCAVRETRLGRSWGRRGQSSAAAHAAACCSGRAGPGVAADGEDQPCPDGGGVVLGVCVGRCHDPSRPPCRADCAARPRSGPRATGGTRRRVPAHRRCHACAACARLSGVDGLARRTSGAASMPIWSAPARSHGNGCTFRSSRPRSRSSSVPANDVTVLRLSTQHQVRANPLMSQRPGTSRHSLGEASTELSRQPCASAPRPGPGYASGGAGRGFLWMSRGLSEPR